MNQIYYQSRLSHVCQRVEGPHCCAGSYSSRLPKSVLLSSDLESGIFLMLAVTLDTLLNALSFLIIGKVTI